MKLEMAVLHSTGGAEGTWNTVIIDVPNIAPGMTYAMMDAIAREYFHGLDEFDDCVGAYLFNDVVEDF